MANLQNYNGRYCESEFEYAFLSFLEAEGWHYLHGNSIPRENKTAVLYADDMEQFLSKTNADLTADEIHQIMDRVRLVGAESEFSTLHTVYGWMVDGVQFVPQSGRVWAVARHGPKGPSGMLWSLLATKNESICRAASGLSN